MPGEARPQMPLQSQPAHGFCDDERRIAPVREHRAEQADHGFLRVVDRRCWWLPGHWRRVLPPRQMVRVVCIRGGRRCHSRCIHVRILSYSSYFARRARSKSGYIGSTKQGPLHEPTREARRPLPRDFLKPQQISQIPFRSSQFIISHHFPVSIAHAPRAYPVLVWYRSASAPAPVVVRLHLVWSLLNLLTYSLTCIAACGFRPHGTLICGGSQASHRR